MSILFFPSVPIIKLDENTIETGTDGLQVKNKVIYQTDSDLYLNSLGSKTHYKGYLRGNMSGAGTYGRLKIGGVLPYDGSSRYFTSSGALSGVATTTNTFTKMSALGDFVLTFEIIKTPADKIVLIGKLVKYASANQIYTEDVSSFYTTGTTITEMEWETDGTLIVEKFYLEELSEAD